jgi:hypothetical protein
MPKEEAGGYCVLLLQLFDWLVPPCLRLVTKDCKTVSCSDIDIVLADHGISLMLLLPGMNLLEFPPSPHSGRSGARDQPRA